MTRRDRLIAILAYLVAFVLLFVLVGIVGGSLGPLEFLFILIVALPIGMLIARPVRTSLQRSRRSS